MYILFSVNKRKQRKNQEKESQCHPPPGPPPPGLKPPPPVYDERLTDEPPLTVPPLVMRPPKYDVPPLTLALDRSVGCVLPLTTRPLPPLDGVMNENVSLPIIMAYQIFGDHDA